MPLKSFIVPRLAENLLSQKRLEKNRAKFEAARRKAAEPLTIEFFHDPSDPYSQLLQKVLPQFHGKYDVELRTHLVRPPGNSAAPEREKLAAYAKIDAARLAAKAGIVFDVQDLPPAAQTQAADARLKDLGHYMGGMLYYGGEWYWGLDRLHYLEDRLLGLGRAFKNLPNKTQSKIYEPPSGLSGTGGTGAELHWYLSFRSPYTAIARDRVKAIAEAYGAQLRLRFVLPMVMRGLPVPPAKKKYIPFDTAREARRLGVAFGRIMDPVGRPVELGYSLLPWAERQGRGYAYAQSWLSAVWAEGVDAGAPAGLRKIVTRAGLDWDAAKDIAGNEDWRDQAEINRLEMMDYGIWGVPSFRLGSTITWGQDRLWVMEDALKKMA